MKVLKLVQNPNPLRRVQLDVIIDGLERFVEIRQDTEVLEVDI